MAITGLLLGYLIMALYAMFILALIAGIALPVFNTVAERGKETRSLAMAKQIGLSCKLYAGDNDGQFPKTLEDLVPTYLQDRNVFVCPLDETHSAMGYDYFGGTNSDDPHRVLLQSKATSHDGKRVVIYVDDSGEMVKR